MASFVQCITLLFVLMWILGGIAAGSVVAIMALSRPHSPPKSSAIAEPPVVLAGGVCRPDDGLGQIVPTPTVPPTLPAWLRVSTFPAVPYRPVPALALWRSRRGGCSWGAGNVRSPRLRSSSSDATSRRTSLALLLTATAAFGARRRDLALVTVLFADKRQPSDLCRDAGAVRSRRDAERVLRHRHPGDRRSGLAADSQLAGDAVMAVFGAPKAEADQCSRACARAALAILERTESGWPPARFQGPCFDIGVNSGPALVGNIGERDLSELHGHRRQPH